jgi:NAD-dependent deacetylase
VFKFQLHDYIARKILHQPPQSCNYADNKEVGAWLNNILKKGGTEDWRKVLKEANVEDISTRAMMDYFKPLMSCLEEQNKGRQIGWEEGIDVRGQRSANLRSALDTTAITTRILKVRVLVITGAGVSAESGIPTFRGKDGYWRNLDPAKLATPEAFARDPKLVWDWYRERRQRIRNAQPNAAHAAIAKLAKHADEFLLVTQNVDDLHARVGFAKEKIVQIHGDIFATRCSPCDFSYAGSGGPPEPPLDQAVLQRRRLRSIAATSENHVDLQHCPECDAFMRPGVVWFGEQLPWSELRRVENYLDDGACDLVIVAGTTATFGYIVDWALQASGDGGELIEVNPEETPLSQFATRLVREPAAIALPRIVDELMDSRSSKL